MRKYWVVCDECEKRHELDEDRDGPAVEKWLYLTIRVLDSHTRVLDLCPKCAKKVLGSLKRSLPLADSLFP